jgi:hypothetical protein
LRKQGKDINETGMEEMEELWQDREDSLIETWEAV